MYQIDTGLEVFNLFIFTHKCEDKYCIFDSNIYSAEVVDKSQLIKAVKLGIKIQGVELRDNKLKVLDSQCRFNKLSMLNNEEYKFSLDNSNLVLMLNSPASSNIVIHEYINRICSLSVKSNDVKVSGGSGLVNTNEMFHCVYCKTLDVSNLDVSNVSFMGRMFDYMNCDEIIFGNFNTSNSNNMINMFCNSTIKKLDLRSFDTSNVKDMSDMFRYCSIGYLDLSSFRIGAYTSLKNMFMGSIIDEVIIDKSQQKLLHAIKGADSVDTIKYAMEDF